MTDSRGPNADKNVSLSDRRKRDVVHFQGLSDLYQTDGFHFALAFFSFFLRAITNGRHAEQSRGVREAEYSLRLRSD